LTTTAAKTIIPGDEKARYAAEVASEAKAEHILMLDLRDLSNVTDYFLILTGTSMVHLKALGLRIEEKMEQLGQKPVHIDGQRGTGWMVFDYGNLIIHAMTQESRSMFDLERLWGDAPVTEF